MPDYVIQAGSPSNLVMLRLCRTMYRSIGIVDDHYIVKTHKGFKKAGLLHHAKTVEENLKYLRKQRNEEGK